MNANETIVAPQLSPTIQSFISFVRTGKRLKCERGHIGVVCDERKFRVIADEKSLKLIDLAHVAILATLEDGRVYVNGTDVTEGIIKLQVKFGKKVEEVLLYGKELKEVMETLHERLKQEFLNTAQKS